MSVIDSIREILISGGEQLISIRSAYSLYSYAGALITFALLFVLVRKRRIVSLARIWRAAFPAKIVSHPSTLVDLRMFVLNGLVLSSAYGLAIIGSPYWQALTQKALLALFGPAEPFPAPLWLILGLTTLVELLFVEFGYWFAHYLMHKIPLLWEFHKVHHSAEVMTPLTEWRQHPVEMLLFPNVIGLCGGAAYGVLVHLFGAAQPLTLWQVNIFLLAFFLTISHLRHSHLWLPFTGWWGRLLQSPAHHQIHHSADPKHYDTNLGFSLAIWDWAFGTLWIPRKNERVTLGIGPESRSFDTVTSGLISPFAKIARSFRAKASQ